MAARRSMPDDFVEVAHRLQRRTSHIQGYYGAGQTTIARWMAEAGIPMRGSNTRPTPTDFLQVAPSMSIMELSRHYRADKGTVRRWVDEAGIEVKKGKSQGTKPTPIPADFAQVAPTMGIMALSQHYKICHKTIKRWVILSGVQPKPFNPKERGPYTRRARTVTNILLRQIVKPTVKSIYDEAADALRRERFPVNRCNEKGSFNPKGDFWRVGWSVLTGDELLQRAARYRSAAA